MLDFTESDTMDQFCIVDEMKPEQIEDDPCYIEYVEEELICDGQAGDELESDTGSDFKSEQSPSKASKSEQIEQDGLTYNCELCSKTFGENFIFKSNLKLQTLYFTYFLHSHSRPERILPPPLQTHPLIQHD